MPHRKLQPSGDHILIQYADAPQAAVAVARRSRRKLKASPARVIAVGPGEAGADGSVIPLGLKVGERILVDRTCGVRITLKQQNYAVIRQSDLVAQA
jgi:co-chaperonin GroES (HSP10)